MWVAGRYHIGSKIVRRERLVPKCYFGHCFKNRTYFFKETPVELFSKHEIASKQPREQMVLS